MYVECVMRLFTSFAILFSLLPNWKCSLQVRHVHCIVRFPVRKHKKMSSSYFLPEVSRRLRLGGRRLSSVNGFCFRVCVGRGWCWVCSFIKIGSWRHVSPKRVLRFRLSDSAPQREHASHLLIRKCIPRSVWSEHYYRSAWHSILASKETHSRPFTVIRWFNMRMRSSN